MNRLLLAFTVTAITGLNQTTFTEILGIVTDPSGAVVPNAKVKLRRTATGQLREWRTGRPWRSPRSPSLRDHWPKESKQQF